MRACISSYLEDKDLNHTPVFYNAASVNHMF